jgi:hypothetical protein
MCRWVLLSLQVIFWAARAAVITPPGMPNLPRATPTSTISSPTTSWQPFPTFTPAPECSSLTVSHRQRRVEIYQGCVGRDASCCPPGLPKNIYSPGRCPQGYTTQDAHVGLDPLGTDTVEWEATCVLR